MITRINLLPYRAANRRNVQRQFNAALIMTFIGGLAVVVASHLAIAGYISQQDSRNEIIVSQNKKLDTQIEEITRLKGEIEAIKSRKDVIESLQADRSASVLILEEMVKLTPPGMYYTNLKQDGLKIETRGYSESNELVADLMNNINGSEFLEKPMLVEIKGDKFGERHLSSFVVRYLLKRETTEASVKKDVSKSSTEAKKGSAK